MLVPGLSLALSILFASCRLMAHMAFYGMTGIRESFHSPCLCNGVWHFPRVRPSVIPKLVFCAPCLLPCAGAVTGYTNK